MKPHLLALAAAASLLSCSRAVPDRRATKDPSAAPPPVSTPPAAASSGAAAPVTAPSVGGAQPGDAIDPRFVAEMKEAFAAYKAWGRVDDELRWAPFLCRLPNPGRPRMSHADDGGHAKKLYSLFAREHEAYLGLGLPRAAAPPSRPPPRPQHALQAIVKESYIPELVQQDAATEPTRGDGSLGAGDHFDPYLREGGKVWHAGTLAGVYVILEEPKDTPGTDDGFVYGTLLPSGEVTSAGRVGSCMGCHVQATHRRLFGVATPRF